MAVLDSPMLVLEIGERPAAAGREVVESCPVSRIDTPVARTESGALQRARAWPDQRALTTETHPLRLPALK